MRYDAKAGVRGRVIDLDVNRPVPKVIWFDDALGEVESYQVDERGEILKDVEGNYLTVRIKGRFRFERNPNPPVAARASLPRVIMGAPKCVRCPCPLTLPGDDLCPACRASQNMTGQSRSRDGQHHPMRVERIINPLLNRRCGTKGCGRLATYSVSDEVGVTPELGLFRGRRTAYERGATVARRWYCPFHFQPPRILDAKGEIMEELHEAGGVRPQ